MNIKRILRRISSIRQPFILVLILLVSLVSIVSLQGLSVTWPKNPETLSRPIPASLFGLHIHHVVKQPPHVPVKSEWPAVSFGTWRLWDAYVAWNNLEPQKGKWNFETLDRYVELAQEHEIELLLPLALSPRWASARPDEESAYGLGPAAEPRNLEDWRNYVRTVATRYKGEIHYYELWNEPNFPRFYSGSMEMMLTLSREAYRILKEVDPDITVVSPSATHGKDGINWLDRYLSEGGGNYADVIGFHFYVVPDPPEAKVPLIEQVKALMETHQIQEKPLWNTESGWLGKEPFPSDPEVAASYVARSYILNWAAGVERFYWYDWDYNPAVSLHLTQEDGKSLTPAGIAYGEIKKWLVGSQMSGCHQSTVTKTWICQLNRDRDDRSWIVWNPDRSVRFRVSEEWGVNQVWNLAGEQQLLSGNQIEIGQSPLLLKHSNQ